MSERERYKSVFCIPSEQSVPSDMYDEIFKRISESLSNKVLDVIQDGKEYIVRMGKPVTQEETDRMIHCRMYLDMKPLVRCKECEYRYDSLRCRMYSEGMKTADDWFCADGERKDG